MTDDIAMPSPALSRLSKRINAAHERCRAALSAGVHHAAEAGRLLAEAREKVPHGEWLNWLRANVTFRIRTAQAYMRVHRDLAALPYAEAQRVALPLLRKALGGLASRSRNDDGSGDADADLRAERRAAMNALGRHPADELVKKLDRHDGRFGGSRYHLVESAAESGWATDGQFAVKLTHEDRRRLQQLPLADTPRRAPPVESVIPRQSRPVLLKHRGRYCPPAEPGFRDAPESAALLATEDEDPLLVAIRADTYDVIHNRHPDASIYADDPALTRRSSSAPAKKSSPWCCRYTC
jgi:hypothetical protein